MSINDIKHADIVDFIHQEFKQKFPTLGIAICGSVAKNSPKRDSDIDLLFVADFIPKSFQFVFEIDGIKVNILNITPNYIQKKNYYDIRKWLYSYDGVFLGYLFSAKILYDPKKNIQEIIDDCESLLTVKKIHKEKLLLELGKRCNSQLFELKKKKHEIIKYRLYVILIDTILCYWFLKNGLHLRVKNEYNYVFTILKQKDTKFYNLLTDIFPITDTRTTVFTKIFNYLGITNETF